MKISTPYDELLNLRCMVAFANHSKQMLTDFGVARQSPTLIPSSYQKSPSFRKAPPAAMHDQAPSFPCSEAPLRSACCRDGRQGDALGFVLDALAASSGSTVGPNAEVELGFQSLGKEV